MLPAPLLLGLDPLEWGLVALVVWPLIQIPAVLYLSRYVELEAGEHPRSGLPGRAYRPAAAEWTADGGTDRTKPCPRCGTDNDRAFRYCSVCVARL